MANLIYITNLSLDACTEDGEGRFDWAVPSAELHSVYNELLRPIGTYLYGRRMYETMVYWETEGGNLPGLPETVTADFANIWRAAEKIVYSRTVETVSSARTTIERDFDPAAIRRLKESSPLDIAIGGPELAGQAIAEGLVDECHLLLWPTLLGAGKRALPSGVRSKLQLLEERRLQGGVVHLHYRFDP
jgi:dihydrofolate reductase